MTEQERLNALDNPQEFQRLIKSAVDLILLARALPQHHDKLAALVLDNAIEFQRLIKSAVDLTLLATAFPQHIEIFGLPTVTEALVALHARIARLQQESQQEIEKNVSVLSKLKTFNLPEPLIIEIAAMTANPKYHNSHDSLKLARNHLNHELRIASLPPAATLIHHHGLLHSLINNHQDKDPQQQHAFDKLHGLTVFKNP